jgi:glutamate formiminotransferase
MVDQMDTETQNIRQEVLRQCWYMRGGLTYDEAMQMSIADRKIISSIISDNMETTKKSGLPFF